MRFGMLSTCLIFLLASSILTAITTALLHLGRLRSREHLQKMPLVFFFQHLLKPFFGPNKIWEGFFECLSFSKHLLSLCYAVVAVMLIEPYVTPNEEFRMSGIFTMTLIILATFLTSNMLFKMIATVKPASTLKVFSFISAIFLTASAPLAAAFMKVTEFLCLKKKTTHERIPSIKEKILEVLYESEPSTHLDPHERKLILSVANFKERNAREVMLPRIDVLALSEKITLQQAAEAFVKERYSRIPIYRENIDHIIGVLLYKDVLAAYTDFNKQQDSLHGLVKPVLYTPETKKISQLLQEFRSKQLHLAIIVDEYGGTAGIITIEDILEELVGEIADEDDLGETLLYSILPSGGWIVDARMSILDMEKELSINLPTSHEYDTLGGYIYHQAGAIPAKGWRLHHDDFDFEILSSDERSIDKVKVVRHETSPL